MKKRFFLRFFFTLLLTSLSTSLVGGKEFLTVPGATTEQNAEIMNTVTIPTIDLDGETDRQVIVDKEAGQYLGHVTTCLLEDGKTIYAVYPKGHGRGAIVMKRSIDGGKTWSQRLPTPENWETSREVPTIHRVVDPSGVERLIIWSGLYPARLAMSEDEGRNWSELEPAGDWGGIVVMGFVEPLKTGKGHYLAMFHDDGRFIKGSGKTTGTFTLYKTVSKDGGLTWSYPDSVWSGSDIHLCEPGCIRSPDGKQLAVLLRENARRKNSHVIFSNDEGKTWSEPRELPLALTGDRHTPKYAEDGRLFISFRCRSPEDLVASRPFETDWVGWIGTYEDIVRGSEGQYVIRLKDNKYRYDTTYPGVELLPDGSFVTTTYGHWVEGEEPYIISVRFLLDEIDKRGAGQRGSELLMIDTRLQLTGLFAATYTPFNNDGSLNLDRIPQMVEHLGKRGISGLYVCGSTGEGMSLSTEERQAVAEAFVKATGDDLTTVVHVGHNSLTEARHLAAHAQQIGADAVSATAPSYYKLTEVALLVDCMEEIASVTPALPFYYYDIPEMTGVEVDMVEFLRLGGETISNLVGLKYTSLNVPEFQACLEFEDRRFEALWGSDEMLLSALVAGGQAAIGSTYNIAGPLYNRLIEAFEKGDLEEARRCQSLSVSLIRRISKYPFHPAMKEIMKMNGIDCGPCRRPLGRITAPQIESLRNDLEAIGYFEWSRP